MRIKAGLFTARMIVVAFAFTTFLGAALAAESQPPLDQFQGTWVMLSGERDGKKISDDHLKKSVITYKGNQGELVAPHQHNEAILFEIVKVDPATSPKQFHLIRKNGPSAGKTIVAIYEFDGADQFKFAFDPAAVTPPKDFTTKEGTGFISHVWKRSKP